MSDIKKDSANSPQTPAVKPSRSEAVTAKELDEIADEMAGKASQIENRYDEDHDIFEK